VQLSIGSLTRFMTSVGVRDSFLLTCDEGRNGAQLKHRFASSCTALKNVAVSRATFVEPDI